MDNILLSVIIPTYKRNDNLEKAMNSVLKQKGNFELIIVDDNDANSNYREANERLIEPYLNTHKNLYYLKHDINKNGAAARNTGIKFCHGEYITFLDDDDFFDGNRIELIERYLLKDKYDFLCTGFSIYYGGKLIKTVVPNIEKTNEELQFDILCQDSFFGTGSNMVCKSSIVKSIGGFDESFIRHQDMEFMLRFLDNCHSMYCIKRNLVIKNIDDSSNLPDYKKMLSVKEKFLKKFEYIIERYDVDNQKNIYTKNYYQLLQVALKKGEAEDINRCIRLLKDEKVYDRKKIIIMKIVENLKKQKMFNRLRYIIKK